MVHLAPSRLAAALFLLVASAAASQAAGAGGADSLAATRRAPLDSRAPLAGASLPSKRQLIAPDEASLEESAAELLWDEEYAQEMDDDVEALLDEMLSDDLEDAEALDEGFDYAPPSGDSADWDEEDPIVWDNADGYYDLLASKNKSGSTNGTHGPLLERAQIFTTPIITALLVTFGIFLPILGLGVSALAGIQVPPQMMNIAKTSAVSQTRKDQ